MLERYIFHHTMTASQEKKKSDTCLRTLGFQKKFSSQIGSEKKKLTRDPSFIIWEKPGALGT